MGVEVVMAATVGWEDQAWEEHLTDLGTVSQHRGLRETTDQQPTHHCPRT